jgi:hypothetical protein
MVLSRRDGVCLESRYGRPARNLVGLASSPAMASKHEEDAGIGVATDALKEQGPR